MKTRRTFLKSAGVAALAPYIKVQSARKPNIVVIMLDDLGSADFSCYGHNQILTPNVDRFATQSIRYTDAAREARSALPRVAC